MHTSATPIIDCKLQAARSSWSYSKSLFAVQFVPPFRRVLTLQHKVKLQEHYHIKSDRLHCNNTWLVVMINRALGHSLPELKKVLGNYA